MRRFGKAVAALAVAACTLFGGVATANADENYYEGDLGSTKVGTPAVSDVGAHTANVSFDYQIDPSILPKVQSVCFAVEVMRVTSIKPIKDPQFGGDSRYSSMSCSGGTSDGDLTSGSYQSIFGTKTWPVKLGEDVQSYATGQMFSSYDTDMWNHAASGTVQRPVIGLQSNTTYGNTDDGLPIPGDYADTWWKLLVKTGKVCKLADPTGASLACSNAYDQPVDVRSLYAGMRIVLKDGSVISFAQTAKPISDFTTKAKGSGSTASFTDVHSGTPHADDIQWLASNKISEGYKNPNGSYRFEGMTSVYRQDMAAFLRREAVKRNISDAASWKPAAADWKRFVDVDAKTPHAEDILWLAHAGISEGWKTARGAEFRGMDTVKRQDMAAFLKRLADKAGKGGNVAPKSFVDVTDKTPHVAEVRWLGGSGISEGWPTPRGPEFRGMSSVVRQDMAAFIHRLDTLLGK